MFNRIASLAELVAVIGKPGTGFLNNIQFNTDIHNLTRLGNSPAIHDVELDNFERRGNFVFYHFYFYPVAGNVVAAFFDLANSTNVKPDRSVELQRISTRGGLGVAEHDADLLA